MKRQRTAHANDSWDYYKGPYMHHNHNDYTTTQTDINEDFQKITDNSGVEYWSEKKKKRPISEVHKLCIDDMRLELAEADPKADKNQPALTGPVTRQSTRQSTRLRALTRNSNDDVDVKGKFDCNEDDLGKMKRSKRTVEKTEKSNKKKLRKNDKIVTCWFTTSLCKADTHHGTILFQHRKSYKPHCYFIKYDDGSRYTKQLLPINEGSQWIRDSS